MNKALKQILTVGSTLLLLASSGAGFSNLASAKGMRHYRSRTYKVTRRYHRSRHYRYHTRRRRMNKRSKRCTKRSKRNKFRRSQKSRRNVKVNKIRKSQRTKRIRRSRKIHKHFDREPLANDNITINTNKEKNLWQPAIYDQQNAFGFYPSPSSNNQFYNSFSQVLRKTSNKVRNEPFTFNELKKTGLCHGPRWSLCIAER